MSDFEIGERVRSKLSGCEYTVTKSNDGAVHISDFPCEGLWQASRFTPATPPIGKTVAALGETVAALRKAAGLPAFMVGDTVKSMWGVATVREIYDNTMMVVYGDNSDLGACTNTIDTYTLLAPAPCGPAANDNNPAARKFKVGDWVRDEDDDIGKVIEDDGAPEDEQPYDVEFLDGWTEIFDADELEPWTPREGDYVRASTGETGRVDAVSARWLTIDGHAPTLSIADVEPCQPPEPERAPAFKAGDTVVHKPTGEIGVVFDANNVLVKVKSASAEHACSPCYLQPYTPESA